MARSRGSIIFLFWKLLNLSRSMLPSGCGMEGRGVSRVWEEEARPCTVLGCRGTSGLYRSQCVQVRAQGLGLCPGARPGQAPDVQSSRRPTRTDTRQAVCVTEGLLRVRGSHQNLPTPPHPVPSDPRQWPNRRSPGQPWCRPQPEGTGSKDGYHHRAQGPRSTLPPSRKVPSMS